MTNNRYYRHVGVSSLNRIYAISLRLAPLMFCMSLVTVIFLFNAPENNNFQLALYMKKLNLNALGWRYSFRAAPLSLKGQNGRVGA